MKTVLLVEDNEDDIELTLRSFERNGFRDNVRVARSGFEALEYLFSKSGPSHPLPTLILLDFKLSGVGGLDILRRIRADASTRIIPVVMLSTSSEDSDKQACYELGVNSYVRKPVDFDAFLNCTNSLGTYWLRINEAPPPL